MLCIKYIFSSNNLMLHKINVSTGGKGHSSVSACPSCGNAAAHSSAPETLPFLPREVLRGIAQLGRILLSFEG